jgi:hypothetical protein
MRDHGYFATLRTFLLNQRRSQRKRQGNSIAGSSSRPASRFSLELLESRVLLSADLAAAVQAVQIVPEQTATVLVTNNGPDRVKQPYDHGSRIAEQLLRRFRCLTRQQRGQREQGPRQSPRGAERRGQYQIELCVACAGRVSHPWGGE